MRFDRRYVWIAAALAMAAGLWLAGGTGAAAVPPGVKAIADTVVGLATLATGAVFCVRFRRAHSATDAAFAYGFALLGTGSITLAFGQSIVAGDAGDLLGLAFGIRAVGLAIVALAALDVPRGKLPAPNAGLLLYGVLVPTAVLVVTLGALAGNEIEAIVAAERDRELILAAADVPWLLSITNAVLAGSLTLAAYAARLRAATEGDPFYRRLAAGLGLLAAGRIFVLLFPGVPGPEIHLGDALRAAGHALLLWTVVEDLWTHWVNLAATSARAERQRVARELHDGLAQDLALLTAQSSWLSRRSHDSEDLAFVAIVAEHALAESRRTISQLRGAPSDGDRDALSAHLPETSSPVPSQRHRVER